MGLPKTSIKFNLAILEAWIIEVNDPAVENFLNGDNGDSPLLEI
jgi:hypothetical protein